MVVFTSCSMTKVHEQPVFGTEKIPLCTYLLRSPFYIVYLEVRAVKLTYLRTVCKLGFNKQIFEAFHFPGILRTNYMTKCDKYDALLLCYSMTRLSDRPFPIFRASRTGYRRILIDSGTATDFVALTSRNTPSGVQKKHLTVLWLLFYLAPTTVVIAQQFCCIRKKFLLILQKPKCHLQIRE